MFRQDKRYRRETPVFRGDPGSGATLPELQTSSHEGKGEEPK